MDDLIAPQPAEAETEVTSAEDVLMVIYTSGTTGKPKGAVHTHCGFPVKAAQDMAFGTTVHYSRRCHLLDDRHGLDDGALAGLWRAHSGRDTSSSTMARPIIPARTGYGRWSSGTRSRNLGVSPTLIRALIPHGEEPFKKHDLSSLRFFASTGEPWNPDPWMWLFEKVGEGKRPIINYSGGTEISGGIVMGNPILPLKPCSFSAACPGIAADVFDENGQPLRNAVGELVIKAPWIGMTRGFWKDKQRYLDTYWSRLENVWVHGDFAAIDSDGLWYILGRSDDTIKIAGKRLGPAEVESVLVGHPDVVEAAAIGVPDAVKGMALVVFAVCRPGLQTNDALQDELRANGRRRDGQATGAEGNPVRFRLAENPQRQSHAAHDPRGVSRSGGGDTSSLVNPEAVEEIRKAK